MFNVFTLKKNGYIATVKKYHNLTTLYPTTKDSTQSHQMWCHYDDLHFTQ